jgi:hypothetical protein
MQTARNTTTLGCWELCLVVVVVTCSCSVHHSQSHYPRVSFALPEPTTVSAPELSLMVGTAGWPVENTVLEEQFLPVPVTVRNTGARPLCGG